MSCIHYSEYPDMGAYIQCCTEKVYCNYPRDKQRDCPFYYPETPELTEAIARSRAMTIAEFKFRESYGRN